MVTTLKSNKREVTPRDRLRRKIKKTASTQSFVNAACGHSLHSDFELSLALHFSQLEQLK